MKSLDEKMNVPNRMTVVYLGRRKESGFDDGLFPTGFRNPNSAKKIPSLYGAPYFVEAHQQHRYSITRVFEFLMVLCQIV